MTTEQREGMMVNWANLMENWFDGVVLGLITWGAVEFLPTAIAVGILGGILVVVIRGARDEVIDVIKQAAKAFADELERTRG